MGTFPASTILWSAFMEQGITFYQAIFLHLRRQHRGASLSDFWTMYVLHTPSCRRQVSLSPLGQTALRLGVQCTHAWILC